MSRTLSTLAANGNYFEGARWHDGNWWVSDIYASTVHSYSPEGARTDVLHVENQPSGLGWMPDGSLLVVSMKDRKILRRAEDGQVTVHCDLSGICQYDINDMVVDGDGRAYVGMIGFAIAEGDQPRTGQVFRIEPDGTAETAADDLWCPNGIVITNDQQTLIVAESFAGRLSAFSISENGSLGDRRVFARVGASPEVSSAQDMLAAAEIVPDGCAIDAEDHLWVADPLRQRCVRISPAGQIVDEVRDPDGKDIFACALGGHDGRTLMLCAAPDFFEASAGLNKGAGVLLTATVDVPRGTGRP